MKHPDELSWPLYLCAAWGLLSVLFAVLAPSASDGLPLASRLVFWAVHVGVPLLLLQAAQMAVSRFALGLSDWVSVALSGVLGALAFVPVAGALDVVFPDDEDGAETWIAALVSETTSTVVPVVLVWVALNASRLVRVSDTKSDASQISDNQAPAFWAKVPHKIGRDLVSLSAELHYLRVRTSNGDTLILYPFGKAVEELATMPGQQVHRSHWVALSKITDIARRGEGATVHLTSGAPLPVSRKYRKGLSEAWDAVSVTDAQVPVTRA